MRIAIVVHGRFHAFDLAKALADNGQEITLFTNYPKWAIKRFGIDAGSARSFWLHGILSRIAWWSKEKLNLPYPEAFLNRMFGRWAAKEIAKETWDVVHSWSGVSEEILGLLGGSGTLKILTRGSSHIRTQTRLLEEEEIRCGIKLSKPSSWIINREEREYALTDHIRVISNFAYSSFVAEGVVEDKLLLIPSGVSVREFRPSHQIIEERCKRILEKKPLRVLYVGTLSFRKGLHDLKIVVNKLRTSEFQFRFVVKEPQHELPKQYAWADIFIFPTIEDGYAVVLAQAQASGLPIIATTNCAGPDIITEGKTGWVVPIRSPHAFIEKLLWCYSHREELAKMVRDIYEIYLPRDWSYVAKDFVSICEKLKAACK